MILQIIINSILSYLLGSISGSMVLGKVRGVDIRTMGSGNAGGTNAFRTIGPLFALGVVMIDILKGVVSVSLISNFNFYSNIDINLISYMPVLCGIAAVLGHVYPIYYNFKGGKGAGTLIGVVLAIFPYSFPFVLMCWLLIVIFTGFVGLSTILAGISLVVITYLKYPQTIFSEFGYFTIAVSLFLIYTHRENIVRMIKGEENQFKKIMIFHKLFKS